MTASRSPCCAGRYFETCSMMNSSACASGKKSPPTYAIATMNGGTDRNRYRPMAPAQDSPWSSAKRRPVVHSVAAAARPESITLPTSPPVRAIQFCSGGADALVRDTTALQGKRHTTGERRWAGFSGLGSNRPGCGWFESADGTNSQVERASWLLIAAGGIQGQEVAVRATGGKLGVAPAPLA